MSDYDAETRQHIHEVRERLNRAADELRLRSWDHDRSKLEEPERSGFQAMAEELKLADTEYGSDEYRAILKRYRATTIGHHYVHNDHHPEFWSASDPGDRIADPYWVDDEAVRNGTAIGRMSLISLLEMLCDWSAATQRMKNGDLGTSVEKNAVRFGIEPQLARVLLNTARELGMLA